MRTGLLLDLVADCAGDRPALGRRAGGLDFAAYRQCAQAVATALGDSDVANIAFVGINGDAFALLLFASGLTDKSFVPINYRLPDADLARLVARTAPSVAVIDDDMIARVGSPEGVRIVPRSQIDAMIASRDECAACACEDGNDIAAMLFTSGTTGEPKAAIMRHGNLTSYVMGTVELLGADEDECALVSVPPYHIAAISAVLSSCYAGRRIVYLPSFTPEEWVAMVRDEGVTHAMVVPTMLDRILDVLAANGETLPSLKALSYGGGRMPEPVIARALAMLPHVGFVNAYGLTETSSTIALLDAEAHRAAFSSDDPAVRRRIASVGKPLPTVELEIRDETGRVLGAGKQGEIFVRGEQVSGEYQGKSALIADGWFPTNDAGWMDEAGYLFVDGRIDDVIVRGGENISPGEIEDRLRQHPDIADVAVIGVPDDQWGEAIAAMIVPRGEAPDVTALAEFVKTALRSTKVPQHWHFRDALPYNETGKLLRRQLKAELAAG